MFLNNPFSRFLQKPFFQSGIINLLLASACWMRVLQSSSERQKSSWEREIFNLCWNCRILFWLHDFTTAGGLTLSFPRRVKNVCSENGKRKKCQAWLRIIYLWLFKLNINLLKRFLWSSQAFFYEHSVSQASFQLRAAKQINLLWHSMPLQLLRALSGFESHSSWNRFPSHGFMKKKSPSLVSTRDKDKLT